MPLYLAYIQTIALAIIAVSLTVLGKFLYASFNQQLANKQSEIDTLKTQIQHLEGLTAPALADQLKKLAPVVDEYAKKVAEQEIQLRTMGPAGIAAVHDSYRLGITRAILETLGVMITVFAKPGLNASTMQERIAEMTKSLLSTLSQAASGKTPPLSNVEEFLKIVHEIYPDIATQLRSLPIPVDK